MGERYFNEIPKVKREKSSEAIICNCGWDRFSAVFFYYCCNLFLLLSFLFIFFIISFSFLKTTWKRASLSAKRQNCD